jgi:DNA polymerase beta
MNSNIINEFSKLVSLLKDELDTLKKNGDKKLITSTSFRIKQLSNVLGILKSYPKEITLNNYLELKELSGIGKGSIDRIKEILDSGKLEEVGEYIDIKKEKTNILNDLEEVVGIGRAHALELYEQGITSIEMLKQKIKNKEIEVNDKILLGLKYHGVYKINIPRSEMDMYNELFESIINKLNKKYNLPDNKKFVFELCGSYRREKTSSNDIDILISKINTKTEKNKGEHYLEKIINFLKKPLKRNDNKPLLVDDMTDKHIQTKYMGFSKYKNNYVRRIDIRFIPYDSYYSALLYFTGSGDFNKKMRQIAKIKGYKLSEYGLFDENDNKMKITSEKDVFKYLDMEYLPPRLR